MNKDLIKREDAIKAIKQWRDNDGSLFDVGLNQAIREIKRLPSADRPKGEWTIRFVKEDNGMGGTYRVRRWYCSACSGWQTYGETDFCPNCGARMKGADDE